MYYYLILVPDSCCNASIDLQESSYLTQIQCLSPSNNNINSKEILLNTSSAQNEESSLIPIESRNCEYTITNKIGTTTLHTTIKYSDKKPSLSISELNASNKININNNYTQTSPSPVDIEDDLNTTQALMSLAMKISEQDKHFRFDDGFEDETSTNSINQNIIDEISINNPIPRRTVNPHIESHKMDEDLSKIKNSLKLLESLVNIEHNKLEVQKTENDSQESNVKLNGKKLIKNLYEKNKHYKHKKSLEKEQSPKNKKQKTNSKNKNKSRKAKKTKPNYNKLENQINFQNIISSSSIEIVNKQNNSLNNNSPLVSTSSNKSETKLHNNVNAKSLDTISSFETILESPKKDNLSTHKLKAHVVDFENTLVDKNECNGIIPIVNDNDALQIKNSLTASTSTCNETIGNNLKTNSSSWFGSTMKSSDYKKLYEMDRKSLFSPDIIIRSNPTKYSTNNKCITKTKQTINKKAKTKRSNSETNKTRSHKRKTSQLKVKFTCMPKVQAIAEPKSNKASSAPYKTLPHAVSTVNDSTVKNLKTEYELNRENTMLRADCNIKVGVKEEMNILENNMLNNDSSDDAVIQRLLEKYACHNIKPLYVVLDRNM